MSPYKFKLLKNNEPSHLEDALKEYMSMRQGFRIAHLQYAHVYDKWEGATYSCLLCLVKVEDEI